MKEKYCLEYPIAPTIDYCKTKIFIAIIFAFALLPNLSAQTRPDSLLQALSGAKDDTAKVNLYLRIGELYEGAGEPETAGNYYLKAGDLSRKLHYAEGISSFASNYADILDNRSLYDSAIIIRHQALTYFENAKAENRIALMKYGIANSYSQKGFYRIALPYYLDALAYYEKVNNKRRIGMVYNAMQVLYLDMDDAAKAIEYGEKAIELTKETPSYKYALLNLALSYAYSLPRQHGKAEACLKELLDILTRQPNRNLEATAVLNLGDLYTQTFRWEEAEPYYRSACDMFTRLDNTSGICNALLGLGFLTFYKNDLAQADRLAHQVLQMAKENELTNEERRALAFLSDLAAAGRDYRSMKRYHAAVDSIDKMLVNESVLSATEEMQVKYETEKKEIKIKDLENEKHLYVWLGISGGAVLLLTLAFFVVRQRWTQQKVARLEQEKQLIATQAVLDGETAERTRLARDLHDGLGGMLSAVKLNLNNMKNGVSIESEDVMRFDRVVGLLDESIGELRRVAHNMMPDSLTRYGLRVSLSDFCNNIPGAVFQHYGSVERLEPKLEVMIYRTVHELVNNALKHADADEIIVQMIRESDRVSVTVQDDGSGFDPSVPTSGMGLNNIRNRVGSYNGCMDVYSEPGKGTEISVEFKL